MFGRRRRSAATSQVEETPVAPAGPAAREPRPRTGLIGGRYELVRRLGEGGEADVHLARDLRLQREVALKIFHSDVLPVDRIGRIETRVVAALNHYALASVFDARIDRSDDRGDRLFLVMEYVEGESLKQRLTRGPMEVSEACWMGFDLAEGLDHLHRSGFLHRDVKPANVLISSLPSARPVIAKLTDFGIAAVVGEPDLSEFTVGTAAYLSPEQVEGHDAGPASDVYSLGIVLLEAMTGRLEFPGTVEESAFDRLVRDPRMPADLPRPVADLLTRMTARRPEDRVDPHRVAVELQQFLVDDLVRRRAQAAQQAADDRLEDARAMVPEGRFDALLRLTALALGVESVLLVVVDDGGAAVPSSFNWTGRTEEASALLDSMGGGTWSITATDGQGSGGGPCSMTGTVAATPVSLPDGRAVGSVVALDPRRRRLRDEHMAAMRDTAAVIAQEVELRIAMRRVLHPEG